MTNSYTFMNQIRTEITSLPMHLFPDDDSSHRLPKLNQLQDLRYSSDRPKVHIPAPYQITTTEILKDLGEISPDESAEPLETEATKRELFELGLELLHEVIGQKTLKRRLSKK